MQKKTKWKKIGLVIEPDQKKWWMQTHAMLPTPEKIENSLYKIYFSGRCKNNRSRIGYVVLDLENPENTLEFSSEPVLSTGRLGTFDDNGVLPSCVIPHNGETLLYTIGFKPGGTTRMDLFGGLALSHDEGKTFERWSESPIIERSRCNPFINTAPWVIKDDESFIMYYVSGVEWLNKNLPRYNIQIATSQNGKDWKREGVVAINFQEGENALARPYVIKSNDRYRMWFSSKGSFYLPQYAESNDGLNWQRLDEYVDLKPTPYGPDEEMICYPIVLEHKEQQFMFYNGNGYGKNGICLAIEE